MDGYVGLAISPDGAVMAVSNEGTNSILLYRLPDGELQAEVWARGTRNGGKEGDFSVPQKMCFSPLNGNLLFVDWVENRVKVRVCTLYHARSGVLGCEILISSMRLVVFKITSCSQPVQEMTVVGSPVRTIGKGAFDDSVLCIAASQKCIATGLANKVVLLDIVSGVQIRSFGAYGSAQGQLNCCSSVRFTPEGDHLLVAENGNKRLSLFSVTGDFVRAIGVGVINGPVDLDFAPNHDILVADFSNVVSVLSHDGSTLARTFGNESGALKQLLRPCAVAVHNGLLYVLDLSARVQVFA